MVTVCKINIRIAKVLTHRNFFRNFLCKNWELTPISLASFLWDVANSADQIQRRRMWHPIRVSTVCSQNVLLEFE